MFQFVKSLFWGNVRPVRRKPGTARLRFETLESRQVMAADVWAAADPLPPPSEQVSILFPVFQEADLAKDSQGLLGYTNPDFLPAVQYVEPEIFPAIQWISPELTPVSHISPEFLPAIQWTSPEIEPIGHISPELKPTGFISPEIKPIGHVIPDFKPIGYTSPELLPGAYSNQLPLK